jgi:hypothetical protein
MAEQHVYEMRKSDPRVVKALRDRFDGLQLPMGPTGARGLERELRKYFASAEPGAIAKLLFRALCLKEHRADALWWIEAHDKEEIGLLSRELERLRKFAALPLRAKEERKTMITVSIFGSQRDTLDRMGGNLSETVRTVIAAGLESVILSSEHRAYLATLDADPSKAIAIVLDAAMGVST